MNDIERWFGRTRQHQNRTVSLYASLLTGQILAYFRYRLRYALLLDGIAFVIHVAEFLIILASLGGLAAFTVMILRVGSIVVGGAWWGLLEIMRERLRALGLSRDRDGIEREIGSWLVLSVLAATAATIGGAVILSLLLPSEGDKLGHLYAFLVVVELALRMPVRVLHSGMYATRRIYRPLWSLFAPTAAQLLVIAVGVFFYPAVAVVIAIIVANAISIWITVHYTIRLYRLNGLWPNYRPSRSLRSLLPSIPPMQGVEATLAGLGLRLDAVALLLIGGIYGTSTRALDLTAGLQAWREIDAFQFFYLVLPLFRGAYECAAVFYFDFVRLRRIPALIEYRVWFFHRLLWITPVITAYFWGLAVLLGLFVLPDVPFSFLLALLPLFVLRSLIGTYQVRLFAEHRFRTMNLTFVFTGFLFLLVWIDANPVSDLVELTAAMLVLLVVHINVQHWRDRTPPCPTQLPLGDWVRALAAEPGPVRAGTISVPDWVPSRQRSAAINVMRETLAETGCLAFYSATKLVFYTRSSAVDGDDQPHLVVQRITGGAANRGFYWREPAADGRDALDRIGAARWISDITGVPRPPQSPELLRSEFLDIFPDGFVADVRTRAGARDMRGLDSSVVSLLLPAAMKSLDDDALVVSVAQRWVSPIFDHNKVRMVFVLPSTPASPAFHRWLRTLKAWRLGEWPSRRADHAP